MPPARYILTFSAPSFQTETISPFEVAVAQTVTINATLRVGDVSQSITVEAAETQVESSTAHEVNLLKGVICCMIFRRMYCVVAEPEDTLYAKRRTVNFNSEICFRA
jgi:hypothetical protein